MSQESVEYPIFALIGALAVALAVLMGAFGAHGLELAFDKNPRMEKAWSIAVDYQMFHGLGLFVLGVVRLDQVRSKLWIMAGSLTTLGIMLFSMSIYAWVLGGPDLLIRFTPIGGFSFVLAWVLLGLHQAISFRDRKRKLIS